MSDLHARETQPDDWEGAVVELVEEGRGVGHVFVEGGQALAEFFPDEGGEPWVFVLDDLQRVLDTAAAMLGIEEEAPIPSDGHPVDTLAQTFDAAAAHRGDEDEGFYPPKAVAAIIAGSETLDLAVVSMEGFRLGPDGPAGLPGHAVDLGEAHGGEAWPTFKAGCNVQALALVEKWAAETGILIALEVADREGDRFVL